MTDYQVPLREIQFILHEVYDSESHYRQLDGSALEREFIDLILTQAAQFCEQKLAPINREGDLIGCTFDEGKVSVPPAFKRVYQEFIDAGWPALSQDPQYGGQGLPQSLAFIFNEMIGSANWAWGMYPGLSQGAIRTLQLHASDAIKEAYLPRLVSGEWTGTMCLTEAHCGTDLGLLKTRALKQQDGSYLISGNKIFISAGEHDMAENIIHIVLARTENAAPGVKGISLFVVPKIKVGNSAQGVANNVSCIGIESKMGIHASATCSLSFEGAQGYLLGEEESGLQAMFTFMNAARLGTAIQGLSHTQWGYQQSLDYAQNRRQMRALSKGNSTGKHQADLIICHPAVRTLLLTQKAFAQGGRALVYWCAQQVDLEACSTDSDAVALAQQKLGFLTPIAKAFLTEVGFESANHALQVFGGHGYISEWGMEQNVRDARVSMLYEGTTQIQALDLLGRKVLMQRGGALRLFLAVINDFCEKNKDNEQLKFAVPQLLALSEEWQRLTLNIGTRALSDRNEVATAAVDYLMYSGYVLLAYQWAKIAQCAMTALAAGVNDTEFYEMKLQTAHFYFARILPRTKVHVALMETSAEVVMSPLAEHFKY